MAREDVELAAAGLTPDELWQRPGGVAAVGFHIFHLSGATDRLLTYARGESLSDRQRQRLADEGTLDGTGPPLERLLGDWEATVAAALRQLGSTPEASLPEPRFVGRARLPSTVLGLVFHAAEHASRHTGQVVTTARLIRSSR